MKKRPAKKTRTELSKRLSKLVEGGGGLTAFSKKSGVPRGTIHGYCQGSDPSVAKLVLLAKAAAVSVEYLATGKKTPDDLGAFVAVRYYQPTAGTPSGTDQALLFNNVAAYLDTTLVENSFKGANIDHLLMVRTDDEAMQPLVWDGEWAIVDAKRNRPKDGLLALASKDGVIIRQLVILENGEIEVRDQRELPRFPKFTVEKFDLTFKVLGKVIITGHYPDIGERNRRSGN